MSEHEPDPAPEQPPAAQPTPSPPPTVQAGEPSPVDLKEGDPAMVQVNMVRPTRERLPNSRKGITRKIEIDEREFYVVVNFYDDHNKVRPGEIFIIMSQMQATAVNAVVQSLAVMMSLALQSGVPWSKVYGKLHLSDKLTGGLVEAIQECVLEQERTVLD